MNPFNSGSALTNSFYAKPDAKDPSALVAARPDCGITEQIFLHSAATSIHAAFRKFIQIKTFPCVLGRSVLNNKNYRFGAYRSAASSDCLDGLAHDLWEFVNEQPFGEVFSTFVACFPEDRAESEDEFERLLWGVLQSLHDRDKSTWDTSTSSDPESPNFSFSFSGRSYFVVGLNPSSSRRSRSFECPAMVFNAHFQFQELKMQQSKEMNLTNFQFFQKLIRRNDIALQGHINPNLEEIEAKQYSGKLATKDWRCPFNK